jgi:hypothetical protein
MKTVLIASALALCLPLAASAEECTLSTNQPVLDYGQSQRTQLMEGSREGRHLLVGTRVITVNLSCVASTAMALSFNGEAAGEKGYRFAQGGFFTLKVLSAQLDGNPVRLVKRAGERSVEGVADMLRPGVSLVPVGQSLIARGTQFSAQVEVKTYVDERDTEARSRNEWEGGGHFSVDTFF